MKSSDKRNEDSQQEPPEKEASQLLEEARMVLPGIQALFGFQLVAVFNQPFFTLLSRVEQRFHLAALFLSAVAIALLMTPAAYHRQAEPHEISRTFLRLSSALLTVGMFALMLSIELDCYLIAQSILKQTLFSGMLAAALGMLFLSLWFVLPQRARKRGRKS